ncbi:MAG: ABC transporter permease [Clostridia bacterium]|nr:ABC transporter permease [Clostridia bacterium]
MNFSESFKQAFDSLRANKLRSILTMLGIIMGVFSVITIVAIGNAAQAYLDAEFEKLGANVIQVQHKSKTTNQSDWLVWEDIETIKKVAPEIKNISGAYQTMGEVKIGAKVRDSVAYGCDAQTRNFEVVEMAAGRYISDMDNSTRANVVVVEETYAKKYYKRSDILGEYVILRRPSGETIKLKVVGVIKSEGSFFENMAGDNWPVILRVPLSTLQAFYGDKKLTEINISVLDKAKLKEIGERVVKALEFKHKNKDKYMATNSADIQKSLSNVMGVISSVLLVIAIITLIVGGIGIVNILLVSVTERIREIGIRKALGAQKKDIVVQFLTESVIMTGFSGLVGILLGVVAGSIISAMIKIPPVVDIVVIFASFLGSVALGLIFGVYPAKRAADLDPIESLRYE